MRPKEYLRQIRLLDTRIQNKLEEREMLNEKATSITSSLRPDPVSGSGVSDKVGSCVAKIVDLETEICQMLTEFMSMKRDILSILDEIKDPVQLRILHLRYCRYMKWEQICEDVGYERSNVNNIHNAALQAVGAIMKRRGQN